MKLISNDEIISPRLLKLKEDLEKANNKKKIIDAFWTEIEEKGTPIIEDIESEPNRKLVTFLYKENVDTDEILLNCGSLGSIPHRGKFTRIRGTDIYYKSIFYLKKTRTTYAIVREKAKVPLYPPTDMTIPILKGDPLNKRNFSWLPGLTLAILELPEAPSQPWIEQNDDVPKGTLKTRRLKSTKFEDKFTVKIYLPSDYNPTAEPY